MQTLEVRHLMLIASVADEGNLTKASARLNLTQSALSHQLLDLEKRLGTPLFHRAKRQMLLTEAGQRVLTTARRVLAELSTTEEDLRLIATEQRGVIRLTTECYTIYHWLPALMMKFEKKFPGVEIRIDVNATDRPFEALASGELDLALVSSDRTERGFTITHLFDDEMVMIVRRDHELAKEEFVKPRDVADQVLLTYSTLDDTMVYQRILRPAGLEPRKHMQVRLSEAMIEMVKAGVGVAVMPRWVVAPCVASGAIAAVPLTRRGLIRRWKAARLSGHAVPHFMSAFIEMLAKEGPTATRHVPPVGVITFPTAARTRQ